MNTPGYFKITTAGQTRITWATTDESAKASAPQTSTVERLSFGPTLRPDAEKVQP